MASRRTVEYPEQNMLNYIKYSFEESSSLRNPAPAGPAGPANPNYPVPSVSGMDDNLQIIIR